MDANFTKEIQNWLNDPNKDYERGAMLLLKLTSNQIMYRNLMANPKKNAEFIEYQLNKQLQFRLAQLTHKQVQQMQSQVEVIAKKRNLEQKKNTASEFKAGKRDDHDDLPDEIQALYVENLGIVQRMRELHLKLRSLSLENVSCPDSERYPFLKELIALDKKLHSNWEIYDHFSKENGAETMRQNEKKEAQKLTYAINMALGRYKKKPDERLKLRILDKYNCLDNPPEKLTKKLIKAGILDEKGG